MRYQSKKIMTRNNRNKEWEKTKDEHSRRKKKKGFIVSNQEPTINMHQYPPYPRAVSSNFAFLNPILTLASLHPFFHRQPKCIFRNPHNPLPSRNSRMCKSIRFKFFLCRYIRRIFREILFSEFYFIIVFVAEYRIFLVWWWWVFFFKLFVFFFWNNISQIMNRHEICQMNRWLWREACQCKPYLASLIEF